MAEGDPRDTQKTPDREAILARRKRLVVTALSGVALGVIACEKNDATQPNVCLSVPISTATASATVSSAPATATTTSPTTTASASGSPGGSASPGGSSSGSAAPSSTAPRPPPTSTIPRVCLKVAPRPG